MEFRNTLRHQWNEACLQLGLPSLTIDTSAKIMAVLYQYGNNEAMVFNYHFVADCEYIQKRFLRNTMTITKSRYGKGRICI